MPNINSEMRPADVQGHGGAGEDDNVADREDRQEMGNAQPLAIVARADDGCFGGSLNNMRIGHDFGSRQ